MDLIQGVETESGSRRTPGLEIYTVTKRQERDYFKIHEDLFCFFSSSGKLIFRNLDGLNTSLKIKDL